MKGIGLVFAGGGGKGSYEIGVWKYLHETGLDSDVRVVSGSSVGALNAALFAGSSYEQAEMIWKNISPKQLLTPKIFEKDTEELIKSLYLNERTEKNDNRIISTIAVRTWKYSVSDGFFSRNGLIEMIEKGIDFSILKNGVPCFATCLKIPLPGKIKRFKLNEYSRPEVTKLLLASSAIPVVYPPEEFNGKRYIDGGTVVRGDNVPIRPILDLYYDLDCIVVVHLNHKNRIKRNENDKVIDVIPSSNLGNVLSGTLDFTKEGVEKRIKLGYLDAREALEPLNSWKSYQQRKKQFYDTADILSQKLYKRIKQKNDAYCKEEHGMIKVSDIQSITDYCLGLLSCTEYMRSNVATKEAYDLTEDIFKSIRKLFISSMMYDKKLICVSGLQGAGKTTLVKTLYNIDDRFLNPTLGRGERIPILITEEKDLKEPVMFAIVIDKDAAGRYCQSERKLNDNEILEATKGGDSKIMYLELRVPYMHTNNPGTSFVLLPGFEKKNDYWNSLIEFSVNSSDAAVFVFSETSFSNMDNEKYLEIVENKFGKNLVYALSFSDQSVDDNAELKKNCMDVLRIPENEADRIVCVGSYNDSEKNDKWINSFKDALEKYVYGERQHLQRNSEYLYKELLVMEEKLYSILAIIDDDTDEELKSYHNNAILRAFDRAKDKKRKEIEDQIDYQFDSAKKESKDNLTKEYNNSRSTIKTVKRMLWGTSVEDIIEARSLIKKSLSDNMGSLIPEKYLGMALTGSLSKMIDSDSNTSRLIDRNENNERELLYDGEKTVAFANDVSYLLADYSKQDNKSTLQCTNTKSLLSAVVEMGTYYYTLMSYNSLQQNKQLAEYMPAQTNLVPEDILDGAESSKKFVAGLAGLMGIDLIGDGSINLVAKIASAVGLPISAANVIAGAAVAFGATSVIARDVNRLQCEDYVRAEAVVDCVYDDIRNNCLSAYDKYMDKIRDRIENNLEEMGGHNKKHLLEFNARIEINNVLDIINKIKKNYAEKVYGVESAFS